MEGEWPPLTVKPRKAESLSEALWRCLDDEWNVVEIDIDQLAKANRGCRPPRGCGLLVKTG